MINKILWIGSYLTKEQFENSKNKNIGQASCYTSQKGIIKGIDYWIKDSNTIMDTISSEALTPFPKHPNILIHKKEFHRNKNTIDFSIGFINIKYLNYISRSFALYLSSKKWLKTNQKADTSTIVIYAPTIVRLLIAKIAQKKYHSKTYVIIPDIPELVNPSANIIIRIVKRLLKKRMKTLIQECNGAILFSPKMAQYYELEDNKWILMEGVFDSEEYIDEPIVCQNNNKFVLMYSGAISKHRGIPELLEAFKSFNDDNLELWFSGGGDCNSLVKEYAAKDKRIKHFGFLDSREKLLSLQKNASVLVHTRRTDAASAPYCFPSKLFEYMVSGKPIISVRLEGMPDEYFKYMTPIESLSPQGIHMAINTIKNKTPEQIALIGKEARDYVLNCKNEKVQAKKILDFINIPNITREDK